MIMRELAAHAVVEAEKFHQLAIRARANEVLSGSLAAAALYATSIHLESANYNSGYLSIGVMAITAINAAIEHDNERAFLQQRNEAIYAAKKLIVTEDSE